MTVSRNITFPDDLYKRLQKLAEVKGISVAAVIKTACSELLIRESTFPKEQLIDALNALSPMEEKVIRLRFGLDDGCVRTHEEISHEFNVTKEFIQQVEEKALRKLRHPLRGTETT